MGLLKLKGDLFPLADPVRYDFTHEDSLAARAKRLGLPERDVVYDALLEDDGHAILCFFSTSVTDYLSRSDKLIASDNAVVALGDGGAHYGMICDAAYTTYMLSDRLGSGQFTLPVIIKALTSQPAQSVGLQDRGFIRIGYKADINIINLEKLKLRRPAVRYDLPAGGKRLHQKAEGYVATIVSGVVTRRDGETTGKLPGRLVRGARLPDLAVAAE